MANRPPTMRSVAEQAGVSVQTVSAVINDKPGITRETRERVLAAVEQLGYRPFSIARSLRTGRTRTLALVVSDIANPSFSTIASVAEDQAHSFGYSVVVYNTHDDIQREASYMRTAIQRWVDGVLFVSAEDQMNSLQTLESAGIPAVAIDRIPEHYDGPSVTLDNVKAGRMAAQHLLDLGHRRIAHIAGPLKLRLSRERQDSFRDVIRQCGHDIDVFPVYEGDWNCQSGFDGMKQLLTNSVLPTAVFAANDRMAIGAMQAAHQAGLRVPDDLSFVGLDDIEVAAFQIPPLTTIRQSFAQLATQGVRLLIDLLEGKRVDHTRLQIEPDIVVRQSTAPARAD